MIIKRVGYSSRFIKRLHDLPEDIIRKADIKIDIFRDNPLHPSLRLHELHGWLKGFWSISITGSYRAIFARQKNGDILFVSIGKHDIYKNL